MGEYAELELDRLINEWIDEEFLIPESSEDQPTFDEDEYE